MQGGGEADREWTDAEGEVGHLHGFRSLSFKSSWFDTFILHEVGCAAGACWSMYRQT